MKVSELLSHQGGLSHWNSNYFDVSFFESMPKDPYLQDYFSAILSEQEPNWQLKEGVFGYHTLSVGFYVNELLKRVDPKHRTIQRFFKEEIADPFSIDFHMGLPRVASIEDRVARLYNTSLPNSPKATQRTIPERDSHAHRAYTILKNFSPWRARYLEIPSAIGFVICLIVVVLSSDILCLRRMQVVLLNYLHCYLVQQLMDKLSSREEKSLKR